MGNRAFVPSGINRRGMTIENQQVSLISLFRLNASPMAEIMDVSASTDIFLVFQLRITNPCFDGDGSDPIETMSRQVDL